MMPAKPIAAPLVKSVHTPLRTRPAAQNPAAGNATLLRFLIAASSPQTKPKEIEAASVVGLVNQGVNQGTVL